MIQGVIKELNRLQADGVIGKYAIGGAVAASAYIETTSTEDIDVFVVYRDEPVESKIFQLSPIYDALVSRGATVRGPYIVIAGWPVQFLSVGSPLYDEAIEHARTVAVGDQSVQIMSPEYLAAIALNTGRPKDKVRLDAFMRFHALDIPAFETLITRHGLLAKWSRFKHLLAEAHG